MSDRALMEDVVRHKKVFFNAGYAGYDECLNGRLRLIPDDDGILGLKVDYGRMLAANMLHENPPDFDAVIEQVREIEEEINDRP